jgi:hypothetical protein
MKKKIFYFGEPLDGGGENQTLQLCNKGNPQIN